MSLQQAANYLQSHGRGNDSMLVHMTPNEVRGLQDLALATGGSLTINPHTGLAEAGWLDKLLPTIAGVGLSMIPGVGPLMAAGIVGGAETLRTGDLGKGLLAGMGAYGGAGLAGGLSQAGAAASNIAPEVGATTVTEAGAPIAENTARANIQSAFNLPQNATPMPGAALPGSTAGPAITSAITPQAPVTLSNMGSGIGQLGTEAGRSAVYDALPKYTLPTAGVSLLNAATPEPDVPGEREPNEYEKRLAKYRLSSDFRASDPVQPNPYYRPTGLGYAGGGMTTFDDEVGADDYSSGGIAAYAPGGVAQLSRTAGIPDVGIYRDSDVDTARKLAWEAAQIRNKKAASGASMPKKFLANQPKTSIKGIGDIEEAAAGGSIGGYSDGGRMLKGPGDGMSDSIPATIGRKQPARLADGEFVVPADVVSHLGNGSTDAGARKLYSMMDKIRMARTGKKKQAPAVKTDKYLPK